LFDTRLILRGKAGQRRAIEVKDTNQFAVLDQWHHQFAIGRAVTGDMPGKCVNIVYSLGLPRGRGRAAHPPAERNTHTGDLPLERTKHQLFIAVEVKARPVQVIQLAEQESGKLGAVGDEIALIGQQRLQLGTQQGIAPRPVPACCKSIMVDAPAI